MLGDIRSIAVMHSSIYLALGYMGCSIVAAVAVLLLYGGDNKTPQAPSSCDYSHFFAVCWTHKIAVKSPSHAQISEG